MTIDQDSSPSDALLTPIEARVVGCLMEKQRTTPDQYPLTLNGLVSACNQKSARQPVMNLTPGEVGHTLNQLRDKGLVHASFSGRTERYDHKLVGTFFLSREEQAVLCVLMLRGAQTPGELRTNGARLAEFRDLDAVASTLQGLIERNPALAVELPRPPGRREQRFAHLLCGKPAPEVLEALAAAPVGRSRETPPPQNDRIVVLETEVAALRAELEQLWTLTGLADQRRD